MQTSCALLHLLNGHAFWQKWFRHTSSLLQLLFLSHQPGGFVGFGVGLVVGFFVGLVAGLVVLVVGFVVGLVVVELVLLAQLHHRPCCRHPNFFPPRHPRGE